MHSYEFPMISHDCLMIFLCFSDPNISQPETFPFSRWSNHLGCPLSALRNNNRSLALSRQSLAPGCWGAAGGGGGGINSTIIFAIN